MTSRLKNKLAAEREQVREAFRNGATLRKIAEVYGASPGTVRNVLIELGETMRPRGRRKKANAPVDERVLAKAFGDDTQEEENLSEQEKLLSGYEGGSF